MNLNNRINQKFFRKNIMREPLSELKKITIIELYRSGGNNTITEIAKVVEAGKWQVDKVVTEFLNEKKL